MESPPDRPPRPTRLLRPERCLPNGNGAHTRCSRDTPIVSWMTADVSPVDEPSEAAGPALQGLPADQAPAVLPAVRELPAPAGGSAPTVSLTATEAHAIVAAPSIEDLQHWFG